MISTIMIITHLALFVIGLAVGGIIESNFD
jgi:hypothetical protein